MRCRSAGISQRWGGARPVSDSLTPGLEREEVLVRFKFGGCLSSRRTGGRERTYLLVDAGLFFFYLLL